MWAAPMKIAPQAYLMDLYERAEQKNQQKVPAVVATHDREMSL